MALFLAVSSLRLLLVASELRLMFGLHWLEESGRWDSPKDSEDPLTEFALVFITCFAWQGLGWQHGSVMFEISAVELVTCLLPSCT